MAVTIALSASLPTIATATGSSTITGRAYEDLNRDGGWESTDVALSTQQIYLFDSAGNYIAQTTSDANGMYSFSNLDDATYEVSYSATAWNNIREDWVPDTTGSDRPEAKIQLVGSATVDFGWRAITRSTTLGSPIATYVGPNGLRIESYDDVVDPKTLYDILMTGTVGPEAKYVTVRFDYGTTSATASAFTIHNGVNTDYDAISYVTYDAWLDSGDVVLAHEYGHAWTNYYADIVQQDPKYGSYLQARGLAGNPNLASSYPWNPREIIAEDYRQLLGPPDARSAQQMNASIPPASAVTGLADFLANTYTRAAAPANAASPTVSGTAAVGQTLTCNSGTWTGGPAFTYAWNRDGAPIAGATGSTYGAVAADGGHALSCTVTASNPGGSATASSGSVQVAALAITGVAMSPTVVKTSGTASLTLSVPASVTARVLGATGAVVSTILSNTSEPAGTTSTTWTRPKSLKAGTYTLSVNARAGGGTTTSTSSLSVG